MNLYFHGGKCCGIKVIAGFPSLPTSNVNYLEKIAASNADADGENVSTKRPFFHREAPSETGKERFDRLIAYCEERRPKGLIEVVLTDYIWDKIHSNWKTTLKSRGFKKVSNFINSNSDNRCYVYHKIYGQ